MSECEHKDVIGREFCEDCKSTVNTYPLSGPAFNAAACRRVAELVRDDDANQFGFEGVLDREDLHEFLTGWLRARAEEIERTAFEKSA